jgi:aromatic-L-amino-acid decarboxylase
MGFDDPTSALVAGPHPSSGRFWLESGMTSPTSSAGGEPELELTGAELRRLAGLALDRIGNFADTLPAQPAHGSGDPAAVARALAEPAPESGAAFEDILEIVFGRAIQASYNTAGPGYLAYIPGGGLLQSALADLIGDAVNRYVGVWLAAPGFVQLEANAIRWLCDIAGYPPLASGFFTSGGSLANFTAVVTARRALLPPEFLNGTLYCSDQAHHSVTKAATLAGFPEERVREVPTDPAFRIRLDALASAIAADRRAGRAPFLIVGNGGTTNTGAVDDLDALAELAAREGCWLHVDAAYGGFFLLTERGRRALRGIHRADSITLDPHKGLFLPYGTGCLLVRDATTLRRAHALSADYLPAMQQASDLVDFCQISPELSRPPRGLRVWLPIKLHGLKAFREALDEKLDLAAWAAGELRGIPGLVIVAEPQLSTVAFRLEREGATDGELNRINRVLLERINARRRVFLTGTTVRGRFILRICVLSFRTHQDRMHQALEDIRAAVRETPA